MAYLCMLCGYFWQRTSQKAPFANFLELRQCEVRRIHILGPSVNKPEVWQEPNSAHSPGYLLVSTENFEDNPA